MLGGYWTGTYTIHIATETHFPPHKSSSRNRPLKPQTSQNGGHCQPLLLDHPHDPSIAHFELSNLHTLESLIAHQKIPCEFVRQPSVRALYSAHHLADAEMALFTLQETAPELAKLMRVVRDKEELRELRVESCVGAVVTSVAARMWPYKFVARVLEDLLLGTGDDDDGSAGGGGGGSFNLQTLTPVTSLTPPSTTTNTSTNTNNHWTLHTPRGTLKAKTVILATNAYTSHLLPSLKDLIVPCRGQMSALLPKNFPSLTGAANRLTTSFGFLGEGIDDYLIQRPSEGGGHLMFGGGDRYLRRMRRKP